MAQERPRKQKPETGNTAVVQGATTGYEAELWAMADTLRGSMDAAARSKDVLGRVYEYFLSQFASAEGKKGGKFYTTWRLAKKTLGFGLLGARDR